MDMNSIDASIGLAFSLDLFKAYKANGILQAPLKNVPGIAKNSTASLQLVDGVVIQCSIQEKSGQRYQIARDVLGRLDSERGPFEWKFIQKAPASPASPVTPPPVTLSPVTPPPMSSIPTTTPRPGQPINYNLNTPPPASMSLNETTPKIIARLNWMSLRNWPYEQRQTVYLVWQLIDGQRSIHDIQAMLQGKLSSTTVNEVFMYLMSIHVIII